MSFSLPRINVPDPVYPDLAGAQQRGQQFQSNQLAMMMQRQQFEDQQQQRNAFAQFGQGLASSDPTKRQNVLSSMMQAAPGMGTQLVPMIREERDAREFAAALGGGGAPAAPPPPPNGANGATGTGAPAPGGFYGQLARAESGGNDTARNPNSSASGRYQIIDSTWAHYAPRLGLTPEMRLDPAAQERVVQAMQADGARGLGRPLAGWEQYGTQLLGPAGMRAFANADPSADALTTYMGAAGQNVAMQAFRSNRGLLEPGMTVGQVREAIARRVPGGPAPASAGYSPNMRNNPNAAPGAPPDMRANPNTQVGYSPSMGGAPGASPDVTTIADGAAPPAAPPAAPGAATVPTTIPTTPNNLPSRERLAAIAVLAGRGNQNAARYLQAIGPLLGGETQLERIRLPDGSERLVPRAQAAGMVSAAPPPTTDVQVLLPQWRALQDLGPSATPTQAAERDLLAQRLRGSGVNVNVDQRGERAEATRRGTGLAEEGERVRLAAETAAGTIDTLRQVRALDANTDRLAPTREVIGGYLDAMGITPAQSRLVREATTAQAFEAAAASVILGRQMEQRGVQTDGDAARMRQTFASLRNTTGANEFILRATEAQAGRAMERAEFYQEWRQRPGPNGEPRNTLDGASEAWNRYIRETPLVAQSSGGLGFLNEFLETAMADGIPREQALSMWRTHAAQRPARAQ